MTPDNKIMDYVVGLEKNLLKVKEENAELAQSELECRQLYNEFVGDLNAARIEIEQLKENTRKDHEDIKEIKSKLKIAVEALNNIAADSEYNGTRSISERQQDQMIAKKALKEIGEL